MTGLRRLACLWLLLLAACATPPERPDGVPEREAPPPTDGTGAEGEGEPLPGEEPLPEEEPLPPRNAREASGPAVLALLGRAEVQVQAGELDRGAALIERALDIEPRNPFVYHRLAALRLLQDQPGQGEALARKSNSLGGDNPFLQSRNWELIAQARRMRGDSVGADAAAARADYYRQLRP